MERSALNWNGSPTLYPFGGDVLPPPRPKPRFIEGEIKMDDLMDTITKYRNAAIAHGEASETGDWKTVNKNYDIVSECYAKLKSSAEGRKKIIELMDDLNKYAQLWAATHSLPLDHRAQEKLSLLSKEPGILGFNAEMTLEEWRKGNLKF